MTQPIERQAWDAFTATEGTPGMDEHEYDHKPQPGQPSLRDRVAALEKGAAQLGEVLGEVRREIKRLAQEIGID